MILPIRPGFYSYYLQDDHWADWERLSLTFLVHRLLVFDKAPKQILTHDFLKSLKNRFNVLIFEEIV